MTINHDSARAALKVERDKLVHQLEEIGATETGDLRPDLDLGESFADAGAVTAERSELIGLAESLSSQVQDIDRALESIEQGTYGTCEHCAKPIPEARLEARPASLLCVDCKNELG